MTFAGQVSGCSREKKSRNIVEKALSSAIPRNDKSSAIRLFLNCNEPAFILMIVLAIIQISSEGPARIPPPVDIHEFGALFGVAVYSFMCHHSIPSLITPMTSKSHVFLKVFCVYLMVMAFYFTLSMTGSFAFVDVMSLQCG
ncbi:hypothetical protein ANCDUO_17892 [Ancylostoma duodenale]|uniref:Amino acid transporter transmembrane domain-containing protein n=1 Tax=Ancylostoma duodenale TaxID=51022 RepID=A0A0C2C6V1_9BILA|nr:hypothetical protein ANCDUO_17892 [Ancylostoma duodenale]